MADSRKPHASLVDANTFELHSTAVESSQQLGSVQTSAGFRAVGDLDETEVGIWEMSVGAMKDIEADEFFVVLSGAGTVEILPVGGFVSQHLELFPGALIRLHAGMHTEWRVTQKIRKVYLSR
ncbi:cupin domain-containing protein [Glutamicibacter sp.]|jgi:Predicted enzyme of the cupin superfamily|uniref:cupin domain-containing protein n=1 Tax=Glutamicibacter sp. TaxID=1931995 RepID=UPI002B461B40|nr:cupin domain-containing protein [Glutamicibacter sp.]HJX77644.1 cupin domain-containing protein [Glutamicibacter sp.]